MKPLKGIVGPHESEEEAHARMASLYPNQPVIDVFGFQCDWIPILYSNRALAPWEAACVWIEGNRVAMQLRKSLEKKKYYLGLVSKEELLQHEAVHALRMAFDEPRFEEVLAYQTATSRWRRFLGPFFRTPRESQLFSILLILFPIGFLFSFLASPLIALIAATTAYGFVRLIHTQSIFARARRRLSAWTERPLALMLHLTDAEISLFARSDSQTIERFMSEQTSPRWRQINHVFFSEPYCQC